MASKHRLDLLVVDGYNVIFKSERYMEDLADFFAHYRQ